MAFSYKGTLIVDDAKVPSTQTNFPVLVSITDNTLKSVGNGGQCRTDGFDIRFFSDSSLTTAIPFELESYNPTTGAIVFWVKIASLTGSGGGDTTFYMGYGDNSLNTNASSTSTWDSNFKLIWHLANSSGSISGVDSTSNSNNGTVTSATTTTGKVGDGGNFNGLGKYINVAAAAAGSLDIVGNITLEAWVFPNNSSQYHTVIARSDGSNLDSGRDYSFFMSGGGVSKIYISYGNTAVHADISLSSNWSVSAWNHVVVTISSSTYTIYLNGVSVATGGVAGSSVSSSNPVRLGEEQSSHNSSDSKMDEIRISNSIRTADWIATEYNNQSAPTVGNFYTSITLTSLGTTAYTLTAAGGTYNITGTAAGLKYGRSLPANSGNYSISGQNTGLRVARKLSVASGTYVISGTAANLDKGFTLSASPGSYSITGASTNLKVTRKLAVSSGVYTISGTTARLDKGFTLAANSGIYTISAPTIALRKAKKLVADTTSYDISSSGVTFIYSAAPVIPVDNSEHADDLHFENYVRRYANDRDVLSIIENNLSEDPLIDI